MGTRHVNEFVHSRSVSIPKRHIASGVDLDFVPKTLAKCAEAGLTRRHARATLPWYSS